MIRVERIDRIPIKFDAKVTRDSRGFARVWGAVVPANALLTYGHADGHGEEHVEFVPESTVNDAASMQTLLFAPITLPHPPEMLDASNTSRYQIGTIIDVRFRDGVLEALHQFTDTSALDRIDAGTVELSPGYTAEIDETPGSFDGTDYAKVQRNRIYNHNAVVPEARSGHGNALIIDSKRAASGLRIQVRTEGKNDAMATVTINETDFKVPDEVAAEMARLAAPPSEDEETVEDEPDPPKDDESDDEPKDDDTPTPPVKTAADGMAAILSKIDGVEERVVAKLDKADKQRKDAADKARTDAKEVYAEAKTALPKSYKWDAKSAPEIMRDAIVARNPDLKAKADGALKDVARLRGMFDSEMARKPASDSHALGDETPRTKDKDQWRERADAAKAANRRHKVLGNEAMRHESVIAAGAK